MYIAVLLALLIGLLIGSLLISRALKIRKLRLGGLAEPAKTIARRNPHAFASTPQERRGLAMAAISNECNFQILSKPIRNTDRAKMFERLGPEGWPAPLVTTLRESLKSDWGIADSAACLKTILSLRDRGHRGTYAFWWRFLDTNQLMGAEDPEIKAAAGNVRQLLWQRFEKEENLIEADPDTRAKALAFFEEEYSFAWKEPREGHSIYQLLRLVRNTEDRLIPCGASAWDLGRLVNVAIWSCAAGYLDNGQAWEFILDAEAKAAKLFRTWEQYGESYLVGRHIHFGVWRDDFSDTVQRLLTHPQSPWQSIGWEAPNRPRASAP